MTSEKHKLLPSLQHYYKKKQPSILYLHIIFINRDIKCASGSLYVNKLSVIIWILKPVSMDFGAKLPGFAVDDLWQLNWVFKPFVIKFPDL